MKIIVDETCFPTRTIATKWKRDPLTNSRRRRALVVLLLYVVYHYHHFSFQSLLMLPPGCWLAWQQCKSRHFLFSYLNGSAHWDMTWRWDFYPFFDTFSKLLFKFLSPSPFVYNKEGLLFLYQMATFSDFSLPSELWDALCQWSPQYYLTINLIKN